MYSTAALVLALLGYPPTTTSGVLPDLAIGFNPPEGPGYVVASSCVPGEPLVKFLLVVTNVGSLNSQPIDESTAVTVVDEDDPSWSTGAPLGAIAAGHNQALLLTLPARAGISGEHDFKISVNMRPWFDEYSFANNTTELHVRIPRGLCPTVSR
ncbi:MAG TPA: hypothetical protein VKF82_02905 [Candidatus Eremiobacteraceae bacterium]|nr:hypothetical protein [Candidatus Eremiobacteraceae bacterium]